jgi:dihydrofolate reductase
MAKLVYGLSQSLDGYVDHTKLGPPAPAVSRHFIELVRGLTGMVYGRRTYEIMRYWDEDLPDWDAEDHDFAAAWRSKPKWVVSRTLKSVGPNATLVEDDIEAAIRRLKAQLAGEIHVAGPDLAQSLTKALVLLMSIDFTSNPSCLVAASHSSPAPGRRSALLPAI